MIPSLFYHFSVTKSDADTFYASGVSATRTTPA